MGVTNLDRVATADPLIGHSVSQERTVTVHQKQPAMAWPPRFSAPGTGFRYLLDTGRFRAVSGHYTAGSRAPPRWCALSLRPRPAYDASLGRPTYLAIT